MGPINTPFVRPFFPFCFRRSARISSVIYPFTVRFFPSNTATHPSSSSSTRSLLRTCIFYSSSPPFWTPPTFRHHRRVGLSPAVLPPRFPFLFSALYSNSPCAYSDLLSRTRIYKTRAWPSQRQASAIHPLLSICVLTRLPATTILTTEPPFAFPSSRVRFVFPRRFHHPRRPRCFPATPERLLADRLATLMFLPGLNLPSRAQVSFARSRSIQYCDLFLSSLIPNTQLAIPF